jgi:hypothetical protein
MSIMDDSGSTWVTAFNDQVLLCSFAAFGLTILMMRASPGMFHLLD